MRRGDVNELIALDQDGDSLKVVEREWMGKRVSVRNASALDVIRGKVSLGTFDLIYSAGLFDYLRDRLAGRLADRLATMLNPSGQLLIANFAPDSAGRAYMECFMDWHLIYRDEVELRSICKGHSVNPTDVRVFRDDPGNVIYCEMTV
jgi:hypothetical protein